MHAVVAAAQTACMQAGGRPLTLKDFALAAGLWQHIIECKVGGVLARQRDQHLARVGRHGAHGVRGCGGGGGVRALSCWRRMRRAAAACVRAEGRMRHAAAGGCGRLRMGACGDSRSAVSVWLGGRMRMTTW